MKALSVTWWPILWPQDERRREDAKLWLVKMELRLIQDKVVVLQRKAKLDSSD